MTLNPLRNASSRGLGLGLAASLAIGLAGCAQDSPRPLEDPDVDVARSQPSTSPPDLYAVGERDVRAAIERYDRAFFAAIAAPDDQEKTDQLLSLYVAGAPERDGMEEFLQTFVERGWAGRRGPSGYRLVESVRVENPPPDGRATSVTCTLDDGVVYDAANPAPGGGEDVVYDVVESARTAWVWVFDRGTWRISDAETLETWIGENRCPPR